MNKYGEVTATDTVRFRRLLPGPIERVWEHLVDGSKRGRWLCSGATGSAVGEPITMTFRNFELTKAADSPPPEKHKDMPEEVTFSGEITAFEPPRVFAHTWELGDEHSEVRYELAEKDGKVLLTLTHSRLDSRELKVDVCGGWHTHLDILGEILAGEEPGPFWRRIAARAVEYEKRIAK